MDNPEEAFAARKLKGFCGKSGLQVALAAFNELIKILVHTVLAAGHQKTIRPGHTVLRRLHACCP